MDKDKIAYNIKRIRTELNMSQSEVAQNATLSLRHYNRIENNKAKPSLEALKAIADVLKVSVEELLQDNESHNDLKGITKADIKSMIKEAIFEAKNETSDQVSNKNLIEEIDSILSEAKKEKLVEILKYIKKIK